MVYVFPAFKCRLVFLQVQQLLVKYNLPKGVRSFLIQSTCTMTSGVFASVEEKLTEELWELEVKGHQAMNRSSQASSDEHDEGKVEMSKMIF